VSRAAKAESERGKNVGFIVDGNTICEMLMDANCVQGGAEGGTTAKADRKRGENEESCHDIMPSEARLRRWDKSFPRPANFRPWLGD
jgi:hypothetical protein